MAHVIRSLYLAGQLGDAGLDRAVSLGWVTADEATAIRGDAASTTPTPA